MKYQCLICLNNINNPAILMLNCECKYYVHYRCYKKWWKENQNCIICLKYADEAYSYNSFKIKTNYHFLLKLNNNLKEIESFFDNQIL